MDGLTLFGPAPVAATLAFHAPAAADVLTVRRPGAIGGA